MSEQQPTITSKNMPTPPLTAPIEVPYKDIEAKPLREPNFFNLKSKNPNISLRWVNRAVGENESQLRFNQAQAMGFVCVKPDEVVDSTGKPCPEGLVRDGRVIYGDLILMKMPRVDYLGAIKYREQAARRRVAKPGVAMSGGKEAHQGDESRDNPRSVFDGMHPKIKPYIPTLAETEAQTLDQGKK